MSKELLQQALDALINAVPCTAAQAREQADAIVALRAALAQPVQPAVGYGYEMIDRYLRNNLDDDDYSEYSAALDSVTSPPLAQPAPQPPSPAEIIALAKSVGAARSEGWGKWTFTYDQLQDFALKVSHWVHAEDKPPEPIKK